MINFRYIASPTVIINTQTLLKLSQNESADNLFYEYYVGKTFINKYLNNFLCFTETYGFYHIKEEEISIKKLLGICNNNKLHKVVTEVRQSRNNFLNKRFINSDILKPYSIAEWQKICQEKSKSLSILIQFYKGWKSFQDYLNEYQDEYLLTHSNGEEEAPYSNLPVDFVTSLYQIYFVLNILKNKYTHYDLHSSNAGLYKLYEGLGVQGYTIMNFHTKNNGIISFKTEYIAKIIDYGRNYFETETESSNSIAESLMSSPDCMSNMSLNLWIENNLCNAYHICPRMKNISHDLRLVLPFKTDLVHIGVVDEIIYDTQTYTDYKGNLRSAQYGTSEILTNGFQNVKNGKIVNNVEDMLNALETFISSKPDYMAQINKKYANWEHISTIDIYSDLSIPYKFTPANSNNTRGQYME